MQDFIKINKDDNVAVALKPIAKGTTLNVAGIDVTTVEDIPQGAAVELTLENARKAGVEEYISASVRDIRAFSQEGRYGCVICNPPYGERLLDVRQAQQLIRRAGGTLN